MIGKIREYINAPQNKKILGLVLVFIIIIALPLTVIVSQQQQEIRQRAAEPIPLLPTAPIFTFGKSVLLDGESYITIPSPNEINSQLGFTVEAWVKLTNPNTRGAIISKAVTVQSYNKRQFGLTFGYYKDQNPALGVHSRSSFMATEKFAGSNCQEVDVTRDATSHISDDKQTNWRHLAGVIHPDGELHVYVDGLLYKDPDRGAISGTCESNSSIKIGVLDIPDSENPLASYFPGEIDELRISNVARYEKANFTPPTSPFTSDSNTLALYHFDGDNNDASGNTNNGQVIGNVQFVDSTIVVPSPTPTPTLTPTPIPIVTTIVTLPPGRRPTLTPTPTAPPPIPASNYQRVFVTSTTYNGNLGGIIGADSECQKRANAAELGGTWKAWLSDANTSASSRLIHSSTPYKLINGATIANNWTDLTDGLLNNPIGVTELGTTISNSTWTNTLTNGDIRDTTNHCSNWTDISGLGGTGSTRRIGSLWTVSPPTSCDTLLPIFCFEQILPTPTPVANFCNACSSDVNKDGKTNSSDLTTLQRCLNKPASGNCANGDINKNGKIDIVDMNCVARNFGRVCK